MDAKTYDFVKQQILKLTGINLDFYKSEQMQRRLATFLVRSHHQDWGSLFKEASNVVIYFTAPVKDELYQRFHNALRPGGVLFVGGTEIVPKASSLSLETADISFYRRQGIAKGATRHGRSVCQPFHRSSL